ESEAPAAVAGAAPCWTARTETPRTDAVCEQIETIGTSMRLAGYNTITLEGLQKLVRHMLELQCNHARLLERENSVLCDFINREMKMTGSDPRIAELGKRIAALSNAKLT